MSRHTRAGTVRERAGSVLFALVVVAATVVGGTGVAAASAAGDGADAAGTGLSESTSDVTLTVTVVDREGNPIGDALLSATWDGGGPVNRTTAGNGKAFLTVSEGVDVTIAVEHDHYVRNHPYVVENASEREVTVEVAQKGRATVVVRNETGRVSNAIVRLSHDERRVVATRTDENGQFTTGEIERGEYDLLAYREGYLRNETTFSVEGDVTETIAVSRGSRLVTFSVTDDHFDPPQPVNNANVSVRDLIDVTTQGTGSVTVSVPVNDEYEVEITKDGYESVSRTLTVRESQTSLNASVRRTPGLDIEAVNRQVVVNGTAQLSVTDEYGDPVANASVSMDGSSVGETDADGDVRIPVREVGNRSVTATKNGLEASVTIEGVLPAAAETPTPVPTPTPSPVPTDTATATDSSSGIGPGFGAVAALAALLAGAVIAARRRE